MPTDCSRWSCLPSVWSAGAIITSARWKDGMSSYPQVAIEVLSDPIVFVPEAILDSGLLEPAQAVSLDENRQRIWEEFKSSIGG